MIADAKLLPCPFCGGRAFGEEHAPHKHFFVDMPDHPGSYTIECGGCNVGLIEDTQEKAEAAWNRRVEYVNSGDSKLSNKERGYLLRLKDRAETLRARTKSTINTPVVIAAAMELHAIEWAINKLDISGNGR